PDTVFTASAAVYDSKSANDASYLLTEDMSSRYAANVIGAYSSGEGDSKPISSLMVDELSLANGLPVLEYYWQPSNNITEQSSLDGHASAALDRMRDGAVSWDVSARWDSEPRLGYHWNLGDDVSWFLHGHGHPEGVQGN